MYRREKHCHSRVAHTNDESLLFDEPNSVEYSDLEGLKYFKNRQFNDSKTSSEVNTLILRRFNGLCLRHTSRLHDLCILK